MEAADHCDSLGRAKDLIECVAKVVCNECSVVFTENEEFTGVLSKAHAALDRRRGHGAAAEGHLRSLCQAMSKGVGEIAHARNAAGSGHGRPLLEAIEAESAEMASEFAFLWVRWVFRRLTDVLSQRSDLTQLIEDLNGGATFRRGELASRIRRINLASLDPVDQRRLGVAVARRSLGGTFVVSDDGARPLERSVDVFTADYRLGLAEGLVLDESGRIADFEKFLEVLIGSLCGVSAAEGIDLLKRVVECHWSTALVTDSGKRRKLVEDMRNADRAVPAPLRSLWSDLADWLDDDTDEDVEREFDGADHEREVDDHDPDDDYEPWDD